MDPRLRHSGTSLAVLRKTAAYWRVAPDRKAGELTSRVNSFSLLANRWVLYHKTGQISRQFVKNVRETKLVLRIVYRVLSIFVCFWGEFG